MSTDLEGREEESRQRLDLLPRLAFLTNFIPPYRKPTLLALAEKCEVFCAVLSTPMEANRNWTADWKGLNVKLQRTLTIKQRWKHPQAGGEALFVHLPVDTVGILKKLKAEVVISAEMGARTLLAIAYRKLYRGTTLLIWADIAESTEMGRGKARGFLRRLIRDQADGYIVNGASGARYLRSIGVAGDRIHRVPYATDVPRFGSVTLERNAGDERRLLYVGQLIERKGLLHFLAVLSDWATAHPEQEVAFDVAGDGPLRRAVEDFATPGNLQLRVLGNVPYERLPNVYRAAGILAFPTFADTWGLVVNEALAAGLPVLGSVNAQATEELIREGCNGWVFRPGERASVYDAIDRSMATPLDQLTAMRENARQTALRITPDYTAELIRGAVADCISQKGDR